jgi:tropinone reductase I
MGRWDLTDRRAVVTGGSKGLGLACVEEFLALGAQVILVARGGDELRLACSALELKYPGKAHACVADVATGEGRDTVVSKIKGLWEGRLDILVNNVGTNVRSRLEEASDEDYHTMVRTNQDSAYFLCKLCLPLLRKGSHPCVVNISSLAGIRSSGTGVAYAMTKAALSHMSEALACEWAPDGIRVNCVAPWMARTPLLEAAVKKDPRQLDLACEGTPLGRLGEPQDTGAMVAFLAMPAAAYITGQVIAVDGGVAAQGFKGPCIQRKGVVAEPSQPAAKRTKQ